MSHLRGTVTKKHIYSPPVAEQIDVQTKLVGSREVNLKNNSPINEARNEVPSFCCPDSVHNNEPSNSPSISVQQDPFLSTLVEIDEEFSKLNARSTPNNEDTRMWNLSHAINEALEAARVSNKEVRAARVYHAQGSEIQATAQTHVVWKKKKKKHSRSNKGPGNVYQIRLYSKTKTVLTARKLQCYKQKDPMSTIQSQ